MVSLKTPFSAVRERAFLITAAVAFAAVVAVYSNHYGNAFHFDDDNTIIRNPYVHELRYIPQFFTDSRTYSILPDHDCYRPLVTTSLAIDYHLGNGNPFWFHLSTFFWYLAQLVLMYFLFLSVMDAASPLPYNRWCALFAAALYGLHPASAETVNYINQRGEIYSSLGVVAGMVLYIRYPALRRRGLYLIPVLLGILSKPPAAVFAPILFLYIWLFEEDLNLGRSVRKSIPAFAACVAGGAFVTHMDAPTFFPGGTQPLLYRLTQPYITWHYFRSFFWPTGLTADSDFKLVNGWTDARVIFGFLFVAALCVVAWLTSRKRATRPVAFGIAWFLLALAPVAWVPLAELENDHRMFFPFIGLTLAAVWAVRLTAQKDLRALAVPATMALALCANGTWQRNEVWHTDESLWRDATEKSPRNGRGLMNYGLTQMAKGDYTAALASFQKAVPLTPDYSLLDINIGIADAALGHDAEAQRHFARALALAPGDSQSYYYYARWLSERGRTPQAIGLLQTGIEKTPSDIECRTLLLQLYANEHAVDKFQALLADSLRIAPDDPNILRLRNSPPAALQPVASPPRTPEGFLTLSLSDYEAGRYEDCIEAARQALRLNPNYAEAYNNIAAAFNALGRYDEGIRAAEEAVRLKPDYTLARNNLAWARSQKARRR